MQASKSRAPNAVHREAKLVAGIIRDLFSQKVERALELKAADPVIILRRVLEYAGVPTVIDDITLPASLFRGLTRARCEAYHGSMYGFFETAFGVRMLKAREKLRAVAADAGSAALLDVAVGTPLLAVDRVAYTFGDRPVEYRVSTINTAHHDYVQLLSRPGRRAIYIHVNNTNPILHDDSAERRAPLPLSERAAVRRAVAARSTPAHAVAV